MSVVGIIAEYDPFHNGHLYHLKESLLRIGAEASVALMSGCFTQRGLPAMLEKRLRARIATECGVDLVIELPFVYAAGNAEMFAKGAVRIMHGLGIVDSLSFGSESGDIGTLSEVAALLAEDSESLNEAIREGMGAGSCYPVAREAAVAGLLGAGVARLMKDPNNLLAIEYLKELMLLGSGIAPITVKRAAAGVGDVNSEEFIAGATAIRAMFREGGEPYGYVPDAAARAIRGHIASGGRLVFADDLFPHLVRTVIAEGQGFPFETDGPGGRGFALSDILSATEGLENRLVKAVRRARTMDEAVRFTKTRRYTETRVRRLILHSVMGLTKGAMCAAAAEPAYARVLAFSETGAKLIRRAKKKGGIPLITNANKEKDDLAPSPVTFSFDVKAAEFYQLLERGDIADHKETSEPPIYDKIKKTIEGGNI
ncbi:MAG: nucleotidyltransferase family protein [Clostridiales Family XIII bacterium]|jgi:predicted nucleotidyltransferase|nr:nucleotidyltransferase family protein [Clostridiales Family XIII bacterium]